jgi:hypothetical protein
MQLVPFPAMKPLKPSSLHIFPKAFHIDIWYASLPALCTWNRIFNLSSGDTTVRETAPARPPAMNEATTGCDTTFCSFKKRGGGSVMAGGESGSCGELLAS